MNLKFVNAQNTKKHQKINIHKKKQKKNKCTLFNKSFDLFAKNYNNFFKFLLTFAHTKCHKIAFHSKLHYWMISSVSFYWMVLSINFITQYYHISIFICCIISIFFCTLLLFLLICVSHFVLFSTTCLHNYSYALAQLTSPFPRRSYADAYLLCNNKYRYKLQY